MQVLTEDTKAHVSRSTQSCTYPRGRIARLQPLQEPESTQGTMLPHSHCALANNNVWTFTIPSTVHSPFRKQRIHTLPAVSLSSVTPPHARTGKQLWPRPGFPLPLDIPHSFRRLCLEYSNLSDIRLTNGTTRNGITPLSLCPWHRENWLTAGTNSKVFCVELDWGFRSFRGCQSSISIIFLLISCSLKYIRSIHTHGIWIQNNLFKPKAKHAKTLPLASNNSFLP